MVKRLHRMYIVMGALCLILVCASLAMAAHYEGSEEDFPTATTAALPVATTGGHARLVALIGPGGTVVRAYGVKAVTHPATGIYCIKPSGTWKVAQVVPAVTVEWGYSSGTRSWLTTSPKPKTALPGILKSLPTTLGVAPLMRRIQ